MTPVVTDVPGAGERTFDRIPSTNPARLEHQMRSVLGSPQAPLRSFSWRHVQLDQGSEGACTGFSATMEAAARPKPLFGDPVRITVSADWIQTLNQQARTVYKRAQLLDVWPGEDYEGSSVDGACLAGRELGWWDAWKWATGSPAAQADQVIRAIAFRGPVMAGTDWREGMEPDDAGWLRYSGSVLGGHAYLLTRYSKPRDAVWTPNSWGGQGQGWIHRDDLIRMAADGADFAMVANRLTPKP